MSLSSPTATRHCPNGRAALLCCLLLACADEAPSGFQAQTAPGGSGPGPFPQAYGPPSNQLSPPGGNDDSFNPAAPEAGTDQTEDSSESAGAGSAPRETMELPREDALVNQGWIGGACTADASCTYAKGKCLTAAAGFPGGMCTKPCNGLCPVKEGKFTASACIAGTGLVSNKTPGCAALCDEKLFPGTGCRADYGCFSRHGAGGQGTVRVCLPKASGQNTGEGQTATPPANEPPPDNGGTPGETPAAEVDWQNQGAEAWRPMLEKYFKPEDIPWALSIIRRESGGNPDALNKSSGASGLFQWMPQYWEEYSSKAGFAGASVFDPEANIATSAYLYYTEGPHGWECSTCTTP